MYCIYHARDGLSTGMGLSTGGELYMETCCHTHGVQRRGPYVYMLHVVSMGWWGLPTGFDIISWNYKRTSALQFYKHSLSSAPQVAQLLDPLGVVYHQLWVAYNSSSWWGSWEGKKQSQQKQDFASLQKAIQWNLP